MSMHQRLFECQEDGRLIQLRPLLPGAPVQRSVLVTPIVYRDLDPSTAAPEHKSSAASVRSRLDSFMMGRRVVVGMHPKDDCDLKRLSPGSSEVWEFRKTEQPALRAFCRFVLKDAVVVTHLQLRSRLAILPGFDGAKKNCIEIWDEIFGEIPPFSGNNIDDYLSGAIAC